MPTASPAGPAARRVFISYARKDGAAAAQALRDTLTANHHDVWLDTDRISGGTSWSKALEEELDACDVLIAVLTPSAFASEICRAEQIWALDLQKQIIPVLATADPKTVPLYLKSLQYRKFPQEQAELLQDLGAAPFPLLPAEHRPLNYDTIPDLPLNHVARESAVDQLRDLVLSEGAGNIAVTALAGMGGIGKTVLATALCRNPTIQRAFPDGIAWVTLGREYDNNFVIRMREVARALGERDLSTWDNPLACENRYRTLLQEKAALVVVDDVWNVEHLKPLLVHAPCSRFLFTTRDAGIADFTTDRIYQADILNDPEACDLLSRWSKANPLPVEATDIIRECGHLAAAIAQIGAVLKRRSPAEWRDVLHALQCADTQAIEDHLPPGQQSFFKSLAVSLETLPKEKQNRYLKLAVMLEDVPAQLVVLQTLWKAPEEEARRMARYFVNRSLAFWENSANPERGIKLHDLQLDYVRACFEDRQALGLIHDALRLSAHVVAKHPEEFASQLTGRLLPYDASPRIGQFRSEIAQGAPTPWWKPLWPALDSPGTLLKRTSAGHSDPVNAVALTADGKLAVSASEDYTLKVWDVEGGRELRTLAGHANRVNGVALTRDAKRAISASWDSTLKVWDVESGQALRELTGHSGPVNSVALTADGKHAISTSFDKSLKIWDVESGRELRTLAGHSREVTGVALAENGRLAVSASLDHTLKVWDVESGRELHALTGHSDLVNAVAMTSDGKLAVSASQDHTLKVWEVESGRELRTLEGHSHLVSAVALSMDGKRAVSASGDNTLKVWEVESGRELRTLKGHSHLVSAVALTADGKRSVSASWDNTLKVWDVESGRELDTLAGHSERVNSAAVTGDGRLAVLASRDHTLKVWEVESGRELRTLAGHSAPVNSVALAEDGRRAVSASWDYTLKVWEVDSGRELRTLAGHSAPVNYVALTSDGKLAVSASKDHTLKVWEVESGRELRTLAGHSGSVLAVVLTGDGKRAVSASKDDTLKVWHVESGRELRTLAGHANWVTAVALTSDGRLAVSASQDTTLKVWEVDSGRELRTLAGHSLRVNAVALTRDGKHAISASFDHTVRSWNLDTGNAVASFHCDASAHCCTFVDNRRVLAGDRTGRMHLLSLEGPI